MSRFSADLALWDSVTSHSYHVWYILVLPSFIGHGFRRLSAVTRMQRASRWFLSFSRLPPRSPVCPFGLGIHRHFENLVIASSGDGSLHWMQLWYMLSMKTVGFLRLDYCRCRNCTRHTFTTIRHPARPRLSTSSIYLFSCYSFLLSLFHHALHPLYQCSFELEVCTYKLLIHPDAPSAEHLYRFT